MNPLLGLTRLSHFDATRSWPFDLQARARLLRAQVLTIDFLLKGDLREIVIPEWHEPAIRRSGLWESTCFEVFIAHPDKSEYLELNLSPDGDWQVFRFRDYRQADPHPVVALCQGSLLTKAGTEIQLQTEVQLSQVDWLTFNGSATRTDFPLALTAVVELKDNTKSYCALTHVADKPDFHRRESFIARLGKVY